MLVRFIGWIFGAWSSDNMFDDDLLVTERPLERPPTR